MSNNESTSIYCVHVMSTLMGPFSTIPEHLTLRYENWLSSQHLWLATTAQPTPLLSRCYAYDFTCLVAFNPPVLSFGDH
jgi:hypothetical protein